MQKFDDVDDPRRRVLVEALATGVFAVGLLSRPALAARVLCNYPEKLPPEQSIYCLSGTVLVKGAQATVETQIRPGDIVETGTDGEIIFVVGDNAMLLRPESNLVLVPGIGDRAPLQFVDINLVKGSLLAVCGPGKREVHTDTAKIEVLGTGFYVESDPERTYFCTCYGNTIVTAKKDPSSKVQVIASHHDKPLLILANRILRSVFKNHTDQELCMIETLVGRIPPFLKKWQCKPKPQKKS